MKKENEVIKELAKLVKQGNMTEMEEKLKPSKLRLEEEEIIIQIRQNDINGKVTAVRNACEALQHLNRRRKYLANNYTKTHQVS